MERSTQEKCQKMWDSCQNFNHLQKAMIVYLKGICPESIWMGAQVDTETIPILDDLAKIVEKGFVTIEGQPGTISKNKIAIESKFGKIGDSYIEKQRGYLSGFVLNTSSDIFLRKLERTGKVYIYKERLDGIQLLFGQKPDIYTKKYKDYIILTQEISDTYSNNHTKFPIPYTMGMQSIALPMNKNLKQYLIDHCSYITIIMKEFGDTGLQNLVLNCL